MYRTFVWVIAALVCAAPAAGLDESRVLLLWNSENAESAAVRDLYVAAHPGVLEFDFDNANLGPGNLTRNQFNNRVRDPLLAFLSGTVGGEPIAERVIAIATTRGLPARVGGPDEFSLSSARASVESEIALIHQDLNGAGEGILPDHFSGIVDNPYHTRIGEPIEGFDRSGITTPLAWTYREFSPTVAFWTIDALTPGDMYLVCRLDAAPTETTTALEEIEALIDRSLSLTLDPAEAQALLDEYPAAAGQLDDDPLTAFFPGPDDFDGAASALGSLGIATTHDETADFVTGPELTSDAPLVALGTYGENHDFGGAGDDPPGRGTYIGTYAPHPAGVFVTYESFSGQCLVDGGNRQGQACALEWISGGGSFAVPTVAEPFTFAIADLDPLVRNLFGEGLTFAEAAYSAIPGLSWQNTPVGDPLARVTIRVGDPADFTGDGVVGSEDLAILIAGWGDNGATDLDGDGDTDSGDLAILIAAWGPVD